MSPNSRFNWQSYGERRQYRSLSSLSQASPPAPSKDGQEFRAISMKLAGVRKMLVSGTVTNFYVLIEIGYLA